MCHKLFMTSVLAFVHRGSPTQVGIGFFVTFFMLVLFFSYSPTQNPLLMKVQIFAFIVQLLNLFLGMMLLTGSFKEVTGTNGNSGSTSTVVWMNIAVVVLPVIQILTDVVAVQIRIYALQKKLVQAKKLQEIRGESEDIRDTRGDRLRKTNSVVSMTAHINEPLPQEEIAAPQGGKGSTGSSSLDGNPTATIPPPRNLSRSSTKNIPGSPGSPTQPRVAAHVVVVPPGFEGYRRVEPFHLSQ